MGKHRTTFRKAHHKNKGGDIEMRYCLGEACYDKKLKFLSWGDGNRLCKRCRVNVERNE